MVALAFLIPRGLVVQLLAKERALADAERQTAVVVAVLTVTTDPNQVDRAIATTGGPAVQRVSVHNLPGESDPVGFSEDGLDSGERSGWDGSGHGAPPGQAGTGEAGPIRIPAV